MLSTQGPIRTHPGPIRAYNETKPMRKTVSSMGSHSGPAEHPSWCSPARRSNHSLSLCQLRFPLSAWATQAGRLTEIFYEAYEQFQEKVLNR